MKDITLYIVEKLVIDKEVKADPEYKQAILFQSDSTGYLKS